MNKKMKDFINALYKNEKFGKKIIGCNIENTDLILSVAREMNIELNNEDIQEYKEYLDSFQNNKLYGASYKPGLHRNGWVLTLSQHESNLFKNNGYTLETNFWYKKGDYYGVYRPNGEEIFNIDVIFSILDTLEKEKINYDKWMEELYNKIKNKELWNIALPGTHNSGIFSSANIPAVRNQSRTIAEQLKDGIRVFDLRVRYYNNEYLLVHRRSCHITQKLFGAIDQIYEFLNSHKKEIVVITLKTDEVDLNSERKCYVLREIKNKLGSLLISTRENCLISHLISNNHRVLCITQFSEHKRSEFENLYWQWDTMKSTYEEYQGAEGYTIKEKSDKLENSLPDLMSKRTSYPKFYFVDLNLWSINIYNSAIFFQHPLAARFLKRNIQNCDKVIFSIDFYQEGNFIDLIVRKNL